MQLVAKSQLIVTREQASALLSTMERVNAASTWIAREAMELPPWERSSKFALQKAFYHNVRELFDLPAQLTVRALANVAACFERDASICPAFRSHAAIAYDARNLSFDGVRSANLTVLDGRIRLPLVVGGPHADRLAGDRGASTLILRKGRWYLHTAVDVPTDAMREILEFLGLDFGIINLATDSDGNRYTGAIVEAVRQRHQTLRDSLQACGTRSAKRHLRKLSGMEARFRTDVNHCLSKLLVARAKDTGRGIAIEDLNGIRDRVTVRRTQRAKHASWAFFQLRFFLTYKALLAGVELVAVDPRNTSRTCPVCGYCHKRNRRSQSEFKCRSKSCGYTGNADCVAAVNIARRGAVSRPNVSGHDVGNAVPTRQRETRSSPDASLAL